MTETTGAVVTGDRSRRHASGRSLLQITPITSGSLGIPTARLLLSGDDQSRGSGGAPATVTMRVDQAEAPALAAALLAAAGATHHRVVDLGDDLPEATSLWRAGARRWSVEGREFTDEQVTDPEAMATVRRLLAASAAAHAADTRHEPAEVELVRSYLAGLVQAEPAVPLPEGEAAHRAGELLDLLAQIRSTSRPAPRAAHAAEPAAPEDPPAETAPEPTTAAADDQGSGEHSAGEPAGEQSAPPDSSPQGHPDPGALADREPPPHPSGPTAPSPATWTATHDSYPFSRPVTP